MNPDWNSYQLEGTSRVELIWGSEVHVQRFKNNFVLIIHHNILPLLLLSLLIKTNFSRDACKADSHPITWTYAFICVSVLFNIYMLLLAKITNNQ